MQVFDGIRLHAGDFGQWRAYFLSPGPMLSLRHLWILPRARVALGARYIPRGWARELATLAFVEVGACGRSCECPYLSCGATSPDGSAIDSLVTYSSLSNWCAVTRPIETKTQGQAALGAKAVA